MQVQRAGSQAPTCTMKTNGHAHCMPTIRSVTTDLQAWDLSCQINAIAHVHTIMMFQKDNKSSIMVIQYDKPVLPSYLPTSAESWTLLLMHNAALMPPSGALMCGKQEMSMPQGCEHAMPAALRKHLDGYDWQCPLLSVAVMRKIDQNE